MRTISLFLVCFFLMTVSVFAQESQEKENKAVKKTVEQSRASDIKEIQLDELHLDAQIEKPSVSILPTRLEPQLENVEYIIRYFDQELKMVSDKIYGFHADRRKFTKIENIKKLLAKERK